MSYFRTFPHGIRSKKSSTFKVETNMKIPMYYGCMNAKKIDDQITYLETFVNVQ